MHLQSEFEARDFAGLVVGQQPVVGVAAVVAVEHDLHVLIDGVGVLQRFARAHEFRLAFGIEERKPVMVVSVTISPAELMPKSSSLTMTPGKPSRIMR